MRKEFARRCLGRSLRNGTSFFVESRIYTGDSTPTARKAVAGLLSTKSPAGKAVLVFDTKALTLGADLKWIGGAVFLIPPKTLHAGRQGIGRDGHAGIFPPAL